MRRTPTPPIELVIAALHALIACRAGQPCLTHGQLATAVGSSVSQVRLALYTLHACGSLHVGQVAEDTGTRIRMRVRLEHGWTGWTLWSRRTPYSITVQSLIRTAASAQAVA